MTPPPSPPDQPDPEEALSIGTSDGAPPSTGHQPQVPLVTGIRPIDRDEALRLLTTVPVGRLVFTIDALPAVRPVNFLFDNGAIVFRTAPGSKLAAAVRRSIVAFEVDEIDTATRTGWSVTVTGHAHEITDPDELARLRSTPLRPWAPGEREHFVRIDVELVRGERLSLRLAAE